MRRPILIIGAVLFSVFAISISQGIIITHRTETAVNPNGSWVVEKCTLYGMDEVTSKGELLNFDSGDLTIHKSGSREKVEFTALSRMNELTYYEISRREDRFAMGGAGPRKGILRILNAGELELLESTAANDPFPRDFSEESIANGKYFFCRAISNTN